MVADVVCLRARVDSLEEPQACDLVELLLVLGNYPVDFVLF